jgi:hypothetical protein
MPMPNWAAMRGSLRSMASPTSKTIRAWSPVVAAL